MAERGRPRKYLTVDKWDTFMNNHWKHMKWKVNGLIFAMVFLIGLTVTILFGVASMIFGG